MKLKEFGHGGGRPKVYYVDPPLQTLLLQTNKEFFSGEFKILVLIILCQAVLMEQNFSAME